MTPFQIKKKLKKAGISLDGLEISTDMVWIFCTKKDGTYSERLSKSKAKKVAEATGLDGFQQYLQDTGFRVYDIPEDKGEWCDPSSRWHY